MDNGLGRLHYSPTPHDFGRLCALGVPPGILHLLQTRTPILNRQLFTAPALLCLTNDQGSNRNWLPTPPNQATFRPLNPRSPNGVRLHASFRNNGFDLHGSFEPSPLLHLPFFLILKQSSEHGFSPRPADAACLCFSMVLLFLHPSRGFF